MTWKIKVKIIRLWREYSAQGIENMEMVPLDSSVSFFEWGFIAIRLIFIMRLMLKQIGNYTVIIIYLSGWYDSCVPLFEPFLQEGDSKIMINFLLSQSCGSYPSTKHPYKIWFKATTRVQFCDDLSFRLIGFHFNPLFYFRSHIIPYILAEEHYNIGCSHVSSLRWLLESLEKLISPFKHILYFLLN